MNTKYTVFTNRGQGINEQCVLREDGYFVGVKSGLAYPKASYYGRPRILAKIKNADHHLLTGMMSLDGHDSEALARRKGFVGCTFYVEQAHICGEHKMYLSRDVATYFADCEIELLAEPHSEHTPETFPVKS